MASVVNDPNGKKRILFVGPDGVRRAIYLGRCDQKTALAVKVRVEALLAAKLAGTPIPQDTAAWLGEISPELYEKLAKVDLVPPKSKTTLAEFLDRWIQHKAAQGASKESLISWGLVINELKRLFGGMSLKDISPVHGEQYRQAMLDRGLRASTISKRLGHARGMLEDGVRWGELPANPWRHVQHRKGDISERRAYVPALVIDRAIEYAPNVWWKLLLALSRYAGLRIPSEAFRLRWDGVNWERGTLTVPSQKTAGQGKPFRVIPIFPKLRPYLEAAWEAAEVGQEYVFPESFRRRAMGPRGWVGCNLRQGFFRILQRAGIEPWPRLFHSLRASLESDLAQSFPLATVAKWLGNTPSIALQHYVDPTDVAFQRAKTWTPPEIEPSEHAPYSAKQSAVKAQNPAQQAEATESEEQKFLAQSLVDFQVTPSFAAPFQIVKNCPLAEAGLEPARGLLHTGF